MAAIYEEFSNDRMAVVITVSGALKHKELIDYAEKEGHDKCTSPTIWDLRQATWNEIPSQYLLSNFEVARKFGKSGHKTAFLFSPQSGNDLITMLEQYTSSGIFAPKYRAFTSLAEASSWVVRGQIPGAESPDAAQAQV